MCSAALLSTDAGAPGCDGTSRVPDPMCNRKFCRPERTVYVLGVNTDPDETLKKEPLGETATLATNCGKLGP